MTTTKSLRKPVRPAFEEIADIKRALRILRHALWVSRVSDQDYEWLTQFLKEEE